MAVTHLVPNTYGPRTFGPQFIGPSGQTVPNQFSPHGQMVPKNLVPMDKWSLEYSFHPGAHSVRFWEFLSEIFFSSEKQ